MPIKFQILHWEEKNRMHVQVYPNIFSVMMYKKPIKLTMKKWVHKEGVKLEKCWNTGPLKFMNQEYNQAQQTQKNIISIDHHTGTIFNTPKKKEG
jgi:hypothetical protein